VSEGTEKLIEEYEKMK